MSAYSIDFEDLKLNHCYRKNVTLDEIRPVRNIHETIGPLMSIIERVEDFVLSEGRHLTPNELKVIESYVTSRLLENSVSEFQKGLREGLHS